MCIRDSHKPYTTVEGILEKDNPEIYDYNIPQRLRDIIAAKDYGRWGVEIDLSLIHISAERRGW